MKDDSPKKTIAPERMPVLFMGHGSPMNGIEENRYSRAWREIGARLPSPKAVLCISAHWLTRGTFTHDGPKPKTIHDFWGFPRELYEISYDCPGSPELAREVRSLVHGTPVEPDSEWGLDHGAWVPLIKMYPHADVPVFQLSIDISRPAAFHYELGRELAPLREKGVLIVGSGNIVHNLGRVSFEPDAAPYDWAMEFDALSRDLIERGDHKELIAYEDLGRAASLSIPTPDHYWPLMYILGLQLPAEPVSFPVEGIAHGSVSMRTVLIGGQV